MDGVTEYDAADGELLTPAAVAALAKTSPRTVSGWRTRGVGPRYIKLTPGRGGRVRYVRRDVMAWLASRTSRR